MFILKELRATSNIHDVILCTKTSFLIIHISLNCTLIKIFRFIDANH